MISTFHYTLNGPSLEITSSDSKQMHVDEERIPEVHDHPDGYKRYYVQQFTSSTLSKKWRNFLGQKLAIEFLQKPKTSKIDYVLSKFPRGYKLFYHEKGLNHDIDRTDAYLYSDHHKFRSPAEFLPHAAWLIAGKPPGRCKCKYDNPGGTRSQEKLNKELNDGYLAARDERLRRRYKAFKAGETFIPDHRPLVEVFLKPAPGPGQVLRGFKSHRRVVSHTKKSL